MSPGLGVTSADYWAEGNQLRTSAFPVDGALHIKGANFLGFESNSCKRGGSWSQTRLTTTMALLRKNGFNALRVPLAIDGCDDTDLETFVRVAGDHGLLVALNMHTLRPGVANGNGYVGGDDGYDKLKKLLLRRASLFCDPVKYWNVFAADLLENPHGMYWGPAPKGEHKGAHYWPQERWDTVAARLGSELHAACSRWLVLVEGVGFCQSKSEKGCEWPSAVGQDRTTTSWWGENLQGVAEYPVELTSTDPKVTARLDERQKVRAHRRRAGRRLVYSHTAHSFLCAASL